MPVDSLDDEGYIISDDDIKLDFYKDSKK